MEEGEATTLVKGDDASYGTSDYASKEAGLSWQHCFFMILATVVGVGVLGIPAAAAKLGWMPAMLAIGTAFCGFALTSTLYVRLYQAAPQAKCLGHVAHIAFGSAGQATVNLLQSAFMMLFGALLHFTAALSLNQILGKPDGQIELSLAIIAGVNFALLQVDMTSVGLLTVISTVAVVLAVILVLICVCVAGRHVGAETEVVATPSWTGWGVSLSNLVLAISGNHIYIELQSESKQPKDFTKAMWGANSMIGVTYLLVGTIGYYYIGHAELDAGGPLTQFVSDRTVRKIVGTLLVIHVIPSYILNGSVLIRNVVALSEDQRTTNFGRQVRWLFGSALLVAFGWYMSAKIPNFSDLGGLCGALFIVLLNYVVPLTLSCKMLKLSKAEFASYCFIAATAIVAAILGTMACFDDIRAHKDAF